MYKLFNIIFKVVLFLILGVAPLVYYHKIGILIESHLVSLVIYHALIGTIPALVYNLPKLNHNG